MLKRSRKFLRRHRTGILLGSAVFVVLFVAVNGAVALAFHTRMYPHTKVLGVDVGSLTYKAAESKVRQQNPLPDTLQLTYQSQKTEVKTADLGIYIDVDKLPGLAKQGRLVPPLFRLFMNHTVTAPVRIDQDAYRQTAASLTGTFHHDPTPAHIAWQNNQFKAMQAAAGYDLNSDQLQHALLQGITQGQVITIPVNSIPPSNKMADPNKALQAVQPQLNTSITFEFGSQTSKASPGDIASWFTQSGNSFVVSDAAVHSSVEQAGKALGVSAQNIDQATSNAVAAVKGAHAATVKLFAKVVTYHYCVALRGVDTSNLNELEKRIAATYADSRGWSLDGQVVFKQVSSGCDYTVWLTAASQMPSFGAICDSTWSCTINNNVVINYDRWQNATTTWNNAKAGTLDEYRAMAINHETGHQLGFQHLPCPAAGQPAPVMEQQSIDLQGCTFNAWPTQPELNTLRTRLGL